MSNFFMALWEGYCIISAVFVTPGVIGVALLYWIYRRREMRRDRNWEKRNGR